MSRKINTNIYFDQETIDLLDKFALDFRQDYSSRSEVIRQAVTEFLTKHGYTHQARP